MIPLRPLRRLAPDLARISLGVANVFVIASPDGVTLVDAADVGSLPRLRAGLARLGHGLSDVRRVLVTHAHLDHVGGLAQLLAATGAEAWAHPLERPVIEGVRGPVLPDPATLTPRQRFLGRAVRRLMPHPVPPAPTHRGLEPGERLDDVSPGLEVLPLPGHAPGQVGFLWRERGILLAGDAAMHLLPVLHLPLAVYTADPALARRTAAALAEPDLRVLGLGHGDDLIGSAVRRATARLARAPSRASGREGEGRAARDRPPAPARRAARPRSRRRGRAPRTGTDEGTDEAGGGAALSGPIRDERRPRAIFCP